jgi:integrase
MARPRQGSIMRRRTARGTSFGLRFMYRGERFYVHLGGEWEGWTEARALEEQRFVMSKVNRGEWTPPRPEPALVVGPAPTFQVEASEWLHRYRLKVGDAAGRSKTTRNLAWRLSVVMDRFGDVPIDRVDFALAERLVTDLVQEREQIERALRRGEPLRRVVTDQRTGRTHQVRRRGVSNSSIRKALDAAERVLRDARRRGALAVEVPDLKRAAPRAERPRRTFLEIEQVAAVLRAAELIEAERRGLTWETVELIRASERSAVSLARELGVSDTLIRRVRRGELWTTAPGPRNRNDVPRRVIVEFLVLTGLRISEFCGLNAQHIGLEAGHVRVPRDASKTDAGERVIPMIPGLRTHLIEHRATHPVSGSGPAFPTRNGTRQHPDNVRARILGPVRDRANELLEADGREPIGQLTPHTLRRTFASILAVCDVPPRRAMYLMRHTDPTLTLAVYQQVLDVGKGAVGALEQLLGCPLEEARAILTGTRSAGDIS